MVWRGGKQGVSLGLIGDGRQFYLKVHNAHASQPAHVITLCHPPAAPQLHITIIEFDTVAHIIGHLGGLVPGSVHALSWRCLTQLAHGWRCMSCPFFPCTPLIPSSLSTPPPRRHPDEHGCLPPHICE